MKIKTLLLQETKLIFIVYRFLLIPREGEKHNKKSQRKKVTSFGSRKSVYNVNEKPMKCLSSYPVFLVIKRQVCCDLFY